MDNLSIKRLDTMANVDPTGNGKVSVSVKDIVQSPKVQLQVEAVKQMQMTGVSEQLIRCDELARLQNETLSFSMYEWIKLARLLQKECDSLCSQLATTQEDARRYQWLNKQHHFMVYVENDLGLRTHLLLRCGKRLDDWIDNRIKEEEK